MLSSSAELLVNRPDDLIEHLYEGFSDTDNHTAVPDQLLIPHIQCLHVPPVRGKRLQKLSALFQYLVVGREGRDIYLVKLAELHIQKTAAAGRPILDDRQILRRKEDEMSESDEFGCPSDRNHVDGDSFRPAGPEEQIDAPGDISLPHHHLKMGFILPEPDHFPVFGCPVRLRRSADIDRLQDVGLPLRILTVEQIRPWRKFQRKLLIISEILQLQRINFHQRTLISSPPKATTSPAWIFFPLIAQTSPFTEAFPSSMAYFASTPESTRPAAFRSWPSLMKSSSPCS